MAENPAFIFTTLQERPDLRSKTIQLIEKSFKYPPDQHFEIDFYPLLAPTNSANNHIIIKDNKLIAHLGCLPRTMTAGHPVLLMGGIAVDDNFRQQGYFAKLMQHVMDTYKGSYSLYILWSNKNELYKKFNFHLAIGQVGTSSTPLSEKFLGQFEKYNFSQLTTGQIQEIKDLYLSLSIHYTCIERTQEDWDRILQISSTTLYVSRDNDGFIQAYFLVNKGFDLQNIIHEVAYTPSYKNTILKKLSAYNLWLPEFESSYFTNPTITYMASLSIADTNLFSNFIKDWSSHRISIEEINDDHITFNFSGESFKTTHSEFFQYLWGPYPLNDFDEIGLPLYIPGVDSI